MSRANPETGDRQKKQLQLLQDLAGYNNGVPLNAQIEETQSNDTSQNRSVLSLNRSSKTCSDETAIPPPERDECTLIKSHGVGMELPLGQTKGTTYQLQRYTGPHEDFKIYEEAEDGEPQPKIAVSTEVAVSRLLGKNFTVQDILEAGVKALSQQANKKQAPDHIEATPSYSPITLERIVKLQNQQQGYADCLPSIYKNNLRVHQINLVAACVANLGIFGFTLETLADEDSESSFFRDNVTQGTVTSPDRYSLLKRDLQPTQAQLLYDHHPYIDCFPFPDFRDRLIKMIVVDPQLEYDFCKDLEKDGLICWGSTLGGQSGVGSGAPWDMRSWEAQPWFIKKWWLLVGGPEGDLYKQSRWWCEMRGDKSSYPW